MEKRSIWGLNENLVAAMSYVMIFVSGIIVLVMEKNNKYVRFHAMQSTLFFLTLAVLDMILSLFFGRIPLIGGAINGIFNLFCLISWLYLIVSAYKGKTLKIPFFGDIAWEQVNK